MANILGRDEWLRENESIFSPNRQFQLIMQDDDNLVLYRMDGAFPQKALWSSETNAKGVPPDPCGAVMQRDGNLVVYSLSEDAPRHPDPFADGFPNIAKTLWSSRTNQGSEVDCFLELRDDGRFEVRGNGLLLFQAP